MKNTNENRFYNKYFDQDQFNRYSNKVENVTVQQYFNQYNFNYQNQSFIN